MLDPPVLVASSTCDCLGYTPRNATDVIDPHALAVADYGAGGGALGAAAMGPCQKGAHKDCQIANQISEFILDFSIQLSK